MEESKVQDGLISYPVAVSQLPTPPSPAKLPTYSSIASRPNPHKHRKCRDIPCCILFVFFWIGILIISAFALRYGDITKLQYGTDFLNNTCGVYNPSVEQIPAFNATNLMYVHYIGLGRTLSPRPICVASCPPIGSTVCIYGFSPSDDPTIFGEQVANKTCGVTKFDSEKVFNRCVPPDLMTTIMTGSGVSYGLNQVANLILKDLGGSQFAFKTSRSLYALKDKLLRISLLSFVLSLVWLSVLNYVGFIVIWLTLVFSNLVFAALSSFFWYNWHMMRTGGPLLFSRNEFLDAYIYNEKLLLFLGIITSAIFLVVLLLSWFYRKKIKLAILIGREASKALRALPFIFAFSIFKYVVLIVIFAYFLYIFALLSTSGYFIAKASTDAVVHTLNTVPFTKTFTPSEVLLLFQIYIFFGFFWTFHFVLSVWKTTIAGGVASWYWARDKTQLPNSAFLRPFKHCFRYHLGSIAIASLIIGIIPPLRLPFTIIQKKNKYFFSLRAINCICGCLKCFFIFIKRLNALVNASVFVEIAVYGYGFCKASRKAISLLLRNAFQVAVLKMITAFLLLLAKLLIICLTFILSTLLLFDSELKSAKFDLAQVICIIFISWSISSLFTAVMEMAIDTIFICFCEDCERNDGSPQRPYYMTNSLKKFTNK